jgi:hypothetical protein
MKDGELEAYWREGTSWEADRIAQKRTGRLVDRGGRMAVRFDERSSTHAADPT